MTQSIFSKKLKSQADSYGVSISEMVMADLITAGYIKQDAFLIAFPEYQGKSALQAKNIMDSIARGDKFKALVRGRAAQNKENRGAADGVSDELIDKTEAAKEILRVAQALPESSKERGEMFVKYMEMLRKNDETVDAGNNHNVYYLPLTCAKCTLYKRWQDNLRQNEIEKRKKLESQTTKHQDDYFGEADSDND